MHVRSLLKLLPLLGVVAARTKNRSIDGRDSGNAALDAAADEQHKYCVVGGGPAGIQLGHFLQEAGGRLEGGLDYIILERAPQAASFFSKFPVHRTLNSINRRFTRSGDIEFNLRHDWNSLLGSHKTVGHFTNWTEEYWPSADLIVEYINAFAAPQVEAGNVRYCQSVTKITPCAAASKCRYHLSMERVCERNKEQCPAEPGGEGADVVGVEKTIACEVLVMANGMWKPRLVEDWILDLNTHSIRYDELSGMDPKEFTNKSVLILGEGNAATETADALRNYARDMVAISRGAGTKQMRDTRYVGDLRGRRTTYLDANSFKSYEGQSSMQLNAAWTVMLPCGPDDVNDGFMGKPPVCIFTMMEEGVVTLAPIGRGTAGLVERTRQAFGDKVFVRQASGPLKQHADHANEMFHTFKFPANDLLCARLEDLRSPDLTPAQRGLLPALRDTLKYLTYAGMEFQKPFDVAITALGWTYDRSILDPSIELAMMGPPWRPKDPHVYPDLTSAFESKTAPHFYVMGSASHGLDRYRYKASGGFIHGFRFNCRALARILENRYEGGDRDRDVPPLAGDGTDEFEWDWSGPRPYALTAEEQQVDTNHQRRINAIATMSKDDLKGHLEARGLSTRGSHQQVVKRCNKIAEEERAAELEQMESLMLTNFGANMTQIWDTSALWGKLADRLNNAGGPYEMVAGSLADTIVYDCERKAAFYTEDIPEDLVHEKYLKYPRLTWSYSYGSNLRFRERASLCGLRSARTAILATFVHPVLQYYPPDVRPPRPDERPWEKQMGTAMSHQTYEHPSVFWEPLPGVSRVHVPDQFVWTDWADTESLGVLDLFMRSVDKAAAGLCAGTSDGVIKRSFDESQDVRLFAGPDYIEELKVKAGSCWETDQKKQNGGEVQAGHSA